MKTSIKKICMLVLLSCMGAQVGGQNEQKVYLGMGLGFDYGGIGGKLEYLPVKHFGLFGSLGYNLVSAGLNAGATVKLLPDKRVSPNLMLFYGYNAVTVITNAPGYDNMVSYGVTIGSNLDIMLGSKGNKLSVGLFVPFRSKKFMDRYNALLNDPALTVTSKLLPVTYSVGFNFML